MRFATFVIISAAAAFAAPGFEIPEALNKISARTAQPKAVPLEFDKLYTEAELKALHKRTIFPPEPHSDDLPPDAANEGDPENPPRRHLSKRDGANEMEAFATFLCSYGGIIERSVKARVTLRAGAASNGDNTADWQNVERIESWSLGDRTFFGRNEYFTRNVAIHQFCLTLGNRICSYRYAVPMNAAFVNQDRSVSLTIGDFPTLYEVCVIVRGSAYCPAVEVTATEQCQLRSRRRVGGVP